MKGKRKGVIPTKQQDGPSFEQAIGQLEKIVAEMEGAELPLEHVLKKYEEGTRLVRFCSQKLEEAEKKIETLTKKADGSVELRPFARDKELNEPEETEEGSEDEEAKLF